MQREVHLGTVRNFDIKTGREFASVHLGLVTVLTMSLVATFIFRPLLGCGTYVRDFVVMERLARCTGGITEANQSLSRAGNASLDQDVVGLDLAVVEEPTGRRNGVIFWVGHTKDTLVVFRALMVTGLTTLTDGLADVAITECTHVTMLSALRGVLVRLQLTAESLDDTLPAVTLGDGDDVGHVAFFESVGERVFLAKVLLGPVELVVH